MDDELGRLFEELAGLGGRTTSAECTPPIDVLETSDGIEIVVDLPGVPPDQIQVVAARNTVIVLGEKRAGGCEHHRDAAFHVAERAFGRFGRGVRLSGAFDMGRGAATLRDGELRVTLPRIEERRGGERRIPIRAE